MTSVLARIQNKIDVLQRWVDHGLPATDDITKVRAFPNSLTQARLWEDPELGVEKIADPGSFTRNHPRHGSKVVELESLIKRLKAMQARPRTKAKSVTDQLAALRQEHILLEDRHRKVVSQLSAALEELDIERGQRMAVERGLAQYRRRDRRVMEQNGVSPISVVGSESTD